MPATSTGETLLPDVGKLSYNGVTFSSLYWSRLEGEPVKDQANRTTKYTRWVLQVHGTVTLESNAFASTDVTWRYLRYLLTVQGQQLAYTGQGFGGLLVNGASGGALGGNKYTDAVWGPVPKILHFQTYGGGRGSQIVWECEVHVPELANAPPNVSGLKNQPCQFNYESALSYDEGGYASVSFKGTLEVPLTWSQANPRALTQTVDNFRQQWLDIQFDLTTWKVARRNFQMSRDKRTYEWEYAIQQLAPFNPPVAATKANGSMSVKPFRQKEGSPINGLLWTATLRCTYQIRPDFPRRMAHFAFMSLLWFRMWSALAGTIPPANAAGAALQQQTQTAAIKKIQDALAKANVAQHPSGLAAVVAFYNSLSGLEAQAAAAAQAAVNLGNLADNLVGVNVTTPILIDFSFEEPLYDDSGTMSFSASWWLTTTFTTLLAATGVWQYGPESAPLNYSASIGDIMGWRGTLQAAIDPTTEVIVDMGGGVPLNGSPLIGG